jgi:large subunit ribosomal protein L9
MELILMKKIANLGGLGERVKVKAGYGRNYLIPFGFAKRATAENLEEFERLRAKLESEAAAALAMAQQRGAAFVDLVITIKAKAGDEGKLFGSVGVHDIVEALSALGIEVEKREIKMPDGPIRQLGEHDIHVHLHMDVDTTFKLVVEPE